MVKRSIDQKLSATWTSEMRIEKGGVVMNRRRQRGVERRPRECFQWKQKDSVREETSVVSGTMKISVKNRHRSPPLPLSHRHKEIEVH